MPVNVGAPEEQVLKRLVDSGVFESEDEAARAAILNYAADIGFLDRGDLWGRIGEHDRRDVTPEQLQEDLERIEDEV